MWFNGVSIINLDIVEVAKARHCPELKKHGCGVCSIDVALHVEGVKSSAFRVFGTHNGTTTEALQQALQRRRVLARHSEIQHTGTQASEVLIEALRQLRCLLCSDVLRMQASHAGLTPGTDADPEAWELQHSPVGEAAETSLASDASEVQLSGQVPQPVAASVEPRLIRGWVQHTTLLLRL